MSKTTPWWVYKHEQLVLLDFLNDYWEKNQTTPTARKSPQRLIDVPQVYSRIAPCAQKAPFLNGGTKPRVDN